MENLNKRGSRQAVEVVDSSPDNDQEGDDGDEDFGEDLLFVPKPSSRAASATGSLLDMNTVTNATFKYSK